MQVYFYVDNRLEKRGQQKQQNGGMEINLHISLVMEWVSHTLILSIERSPVAVAYQFFPATKHKFPGQIACTHVPLLHCQSGTENAKISEGIAGASQSSALKGASSTAIIRPVMMHLLILIVHGQWTTTIHQLLQIFDTCAFHCS